MDRNLTKDEQDFILETATSQVKRNKLYKIILLLINNLMGGWAALSYVAGSSKS